MNIIIKKGIESQKGSNDSNYYPEGPNASTYLIFKPFERVL